MSDIRRKLVIVGNTCGKSSLLYTFSNGTFPKNEIGMLVFDNYVANIEVDGIKVEFNLSDTPGQEDYDKLRPLNYPDSHVILICFSVDNPNSFKNVEYVWVPEVYHFCPNLPVILVCCKKDLRNDSNVINKLKEKGEKPISYEEGMRVAEKIGAYRYLECSAKDRNPQTNGVREVFECATRAALTVHSQKKKSSTCMLL